MSNRFEPIASYGQDRPSRLILFPHTSYETFRSQEWIGREAEWFKIAAILHWSLSCIHDMSAASVLLLQPHSRHYAENLSVPLGAGSVQELSVPLAPSSEPLQPDLVEMLERLGARPGASVDLIIATGLFSHGASEARESALLRACRRVLKPGASLLATFPLQDDLGNPVTARNIQFLDAAERTGMQQSVILGCQGLAGFLEDAFWARLRSQGHAAFDAVFHSLTTVTDLPETLWMSSEALYIGDKV